ncbi:SAG-related sequence [Besnoitia besnoiti]|uniref:SAG-related sequence n=1 Tax=Besnoitia besnoiti TaxID=94643 RepID=A0A2A9MLE1_BESBE|nr:SAG-related sequence [Besnoitia besnoiti]PFH36836.1 SAG-related sequence [Besnoitia besnoiti]
MTHISCGLPQRGQVPVTALQLRTPAKRALLLFSGLIVDVVSLFPLETEVLLPSFVGARAAATHPCLDASGKTTCTCSASGTESLSATISETKHTLEVVCKTSTMTYAPDGLKGTNVCVASTQKLTACKDCKISNQCKDINKVLSGTANVKWQPETPVSGDTSRSLTIPKNNFPYVDQAFKVGCLESSGGDTVKCTVTVKVEARKTTNENNTVTCAYGKESNETPEAITLTPANNSLTLLCGKDAEVLPQNYEVSFCPNEDAEKDVSTSCSSDYKTILPDYVGSWWKTDVEKGAFTLEVPKDKFPEAPAKIRVGCRTTADVKRGNINDEPELKSSICNVDVTIEGTGPQSASASPVSSTSIVSVLLGLVGSGMLASRA